MDKPFFTVIIPTFNRARLLPRAINSVLSQTEKSFEIIITDDGSEASTKEAAEKFVRENGNIRYVYHKHMGVGASKNFVLPLARGQYVTFLGDDDEYLPSHLSVRKRVLDQYPDIDLLLGGLKVIGDEFVPDKHNPGKAIHVSQVVTGGTFFIKKEVFSKIGGFPEKNFANDTDFYEKAVANNLKILKINEPTYIYYRNENSITKNL